MSSISPVAARGQETAQPASTSAEVDRGAEARRLFAEGSEAYNLGKFDVAIARFEAAYELSHATPLLYNLGQAYSKRYELDPDPAHLRKARVLYLNFATISEAAGESALDARKRAEAIDAKLDELAAAAPPPAPEGPQPPPASPNGPYRPGQAGIAGFVLIGSGLLLGTGLGAVGLVSASRIEAQRASEAELVPLPAAREELYDDRRGSARALAFAGIGVGAALLLTGVVLVAVDAARGGKAARRAQLGPGGLALAF